MNVDLTLNDNINEELESGEIANPSNDYFEI